MRSAQLRQVSQMRELARTGQARARRLAAEVSLTEAARALDTTPSTLHRWETGVHRPPGPAALRWAKLLADLAAPEITERAS